VITAAIIGASGYSGAELLRLLARRDDCTVKRVTARQSAGKRVDELYPVFSGDVDLVLDEYRDGGFSGSDVVFIALPSGEAMSIVPGLLREGCRVIDLGGDFRLSSAEEYKNFYRHTHTAPELLGTAVYGLPEINFDKIRTAALVANPGCYPTSAILALLPALQHHLVKPEGIVINSLSGVSGAGRSATVEMSFAEINENVRAYKIGNHQHIPEIHSVLAGHSGQTVSLSFVPHLVPLTRGIYTTIHATLAGSFTEAELYDAYATFYKNAPFVRVRRHIPQLRDVVMTNYCDLYCSIEPRTRQLIIISVIDNLIKGAAGQAIQNMNIMFDVPQEAGL
jgi:N-acetyl-gamma-glutamyl-phosphate reductase